MPKSLFSPLKEKIDEFKKEEEINDNNYDYDTISKNGKLKNLKNRIKRALTFSFTPSVSKIKLQTPPISTHVTSLKSEPFLTSN
jgi:hypothetical protein